MGDRWPRSQLIFRAEMYGLFLERVGFVFKRQRGSHMVLRRDNPYARVTVPDHKQIRVGTLRKILSDAGMSVDQLLEILGR